MKDCPFCGESPKKMLLSEVKSPGRMTMHHTLMMIFEGKDDSGEDFIMYDPKNKMLFANTSSGEYADVGFKIIYCPFCGDKLETDISEIVDILGRCTDVKSVD